MKIKFSELEKMNYEDGVKILLTAGYIPNGPAVDYKDGININDEYYSLFDEITGDEVHCVSYVTYTKDNPNDEPILVDKEKWHWSEIQ
jgi:hypothetical protein